MNKKVKKEEVVEPLRIYVEYDTDQYGGEAIDPEDRWTNHTDTVRTVTFHKLYRQQPTHRYFYDSVEIDARHADMLKMPKLFLAVVRYGTGDTFGHTTGAWYIVGVAPTREIAQAMLKEETVPSVKGEYRTYKRWEGYFESLEDTEIHELDLV